MSGKHSPLSIIMDIRHLLWKKVLLQCVVNAMMTNIENNGAPWQYSQQDRLNWKTKLRVNKKNP
jgi:hypothetical protein